MAKPPNVWAITNLQVMRGPADVGVTRTNSNPAFWNSAPYSAAGRLVAKAWGGR